MQVYQQRYQIIHIIGWWISCFCIFLFFTFSPCIAQEQSIGIDVSSKIVESNQNFSVSVYDASIQNGTPYLVDVTIFFDDVYYQLSSENENRELILTAPEVFYNKTYEIQAYYKDQSANASILVIPSNNFPLNDLVITVESYTIRAYEEFSILVTDKNGQAIENVLVIIEESPASQGSGITNNHGKVFLIAPNEDTITIRAEKQGYEPVTKTMNVLVENDLFHQFITYPYTPIIGSIMVLIGVICYVTVRNIRKGKHLYFTINTNHKDHSIQQSSLQERSNSWDKSRLSLSNTTRQNTPQIEEIFMQAPSSKKITDIKDRKTKISNSSHRWFHMENKKQKENPNIILKPSSETWIQSTDDIHKKIDAVLADQEKKSKDPLI